MKRVSRRLPATAVVVDDWPLVRLGIGQALRSLSIRVESDVGRAADAVRALAESGAGWLLLGSTRDMAAADVVRKARSVESPPHIVVLLDQATRESLTALLTLGADAVLVRSAGPEELADAVRQVERGERFVSPPLMALLVGMQGVDGVEPPTENGDDGDLTRKELEVLTRLAEGRSNKDIADAMFITPATVKTHLNHIYVKLGVAGRQEAIARAVELGLLR